MNGEARDGGDRGRWITVEGARTNNLRGVSVGVGETVWVAETVGVGVADGRESGVEPRDLRQQHLVGVRAAADPQRRARCECGAVAGACRLSPIGDR